MENKVMVNRFYFFTTPKASRIVGPIALHKKNRATDPITKPLPFPGDLQ